jgi:hypothetical protein
MLLGPIHASGTNQQPKKVAKELKTPKTARTVKDPLAIEVVRIQVREGSGIRLYGASGPMDRRVTLGVLGARGCILG